MYSHLDHQGTAITVTHTEAQDLLIGWCLSPTGLIMGATGHLLTEGKYLGTQSIASSSLRLLRISWSSPCPLRSPMAVNLPLSPA